MTTLIATNSPQAIQSHLAEGRIPRYGPILMLLARSALILLAQGLTFLILVQLNVQNAAIVIRRTGFSKSLDRNDSFA